MASITIKKISNGNIYVEGNSLAGKADEITLPAIKGTYNDHKALGMVSAIEIINGFDKMTGKFKWNSVYAELIKTFGNPFQYKKIQVRTNIETHDSSGLSEEQPGVIYMTIAFKDVLPPITIKQNDGPELESEYNCRYLKVEINGEKIIELDVFNNIMFVDGVDVLANYRNNLGL